MKNLKAAMNGAAPIGVRLGSLPPQPTRLVGRAEELAAAHDQVLSADVRLLTLVGPGGVGKTRLAIALAESMHGNPEYFDVRFVDLAPLHEAAIVPAAIARALGARQSEDENARASIRDSVGSRRTLVVLDNFEHVLQAASAVGALIAECPGLVFVVTSREPLHLRWERTLPLGPLAVPMRNTFRRWIGWQRCRRSRFSSSGRGPPIQASCSLPTMPAPSRSYACGLTVYHWRSSLSRLGRRS